MLESQPSGQPAASVDHGRFLWPQRILATIVATMFAIPTLVLLLAGLGMAAEIIRGDLKMLIALPVAAVMAFNSGALSYFFFHGRGLPTWFLRWCWTQWVAFMGALLVWWTISEILKFLRGGNVDLVGDIFLLGMGIYAFCGWFSLFKAFSASK
jgi:hypothetical protein